MPPGCAKAGEGRHEVATARIGNRGRKLARLRGTADEVELVTQPLDDRARLEDGALEGVVDVAALSNADGGHEAVLRGHGLLAKVHEHEAAGTVGILDAARLKAAVAKQGGLLVSRHAGDGWMVRHDVGTDLTKAAGRGTHLGQHGHRDVEYLAKLLVPAQLVNVEEHGAAGVGVVGGVNLAAREVVDEPGVHGAAHELAGLGHLARTLDVVENPGDLGGREVRVGDEAGALADEVRMALGHDPVHYGRGAAALPHDRVVDGLAGEAIPNDDGLALVGDADGADAVGVDAASELHLDHAGHLGR